VRYRIAWLVGPNALLIYGGGWRYSHMESSSLSTLLIVTELSSPHTIACAFSPGLSVHPGAGRRRTWDRGVAWGGSGASRGVARGRLSRGRAARRGAARLAGS